MGTGQTRRSYNVFFPPPTCRALEGAEAEEIRRQNSADNLADGLRLCIAADRKKANTIEAALDFLDVRENGGGGEEERGIERDHLAAWVIRS